MKSLWLTESKIPGKLKWLFLCQLSKWKDATNTSKRFLWLVFKPKHRFGELQESAHLWNNFTCFLVLKMYKHYFCFFICESVKPTVHISKHFSTYWERYMQFKTTLLLNWFCSLCKVLHCNFLKGLFPLFSLLSGFLDAASFWSCIFGSNCMELMSIPCQWWLLSRNNGSLTLLPSYLISSLWAPRGFFLDSWVDFRLS